MKIKGPELTAQDALDGLRERNKLDFPHINIRRDQLLENALIVALREIVEIKKVFNEHTHDVSVGQRGITTADIEGAEKPGDLHRDADGNPLGVVMEDGISRAQALIPVDPPEGDMFMPTLPKTTENYQIMFEALQEIFAFDLDSDSVTIQIARDALTQIGYIKDDNDGP